MTSALAFQRAKAIGDAGEERVFQAFARKGWSVQRRFKGSKCDLVVSLPTGTEIIEVKNEDHFTESDSICVEMFQGNPRRPSGIKVSESTVYIHTFGQTCAAYRTRQMMLMVERYVEHGTYQVRPFGRADNHNVGVLVPKMTLTMRDWADLIDDIANLPDSKVFAAARE